MAHIAVNRSGRALRAKEPLSRLASPASAIRPARIQLAVKRGNEIGRALASAPPPKAARWRPAEAGALEESANRFGRFRRERNARGISVERVRKHESNSRKRSRHASSSP